MSLALYTQHFSLSGRTIVLLGGASSMGVAIAEAVARAGADLIIAGRSEARGHACVEKVRSCGGVGGYAPVDLSRPASLPPLMDYALGEYGKIDALLQVAAPTWQSQWLTDAEQAYNRAVQRQGSKGGTETRGAGERDSDGVVLALVPSRDPPWQWLSEVDESRLPRHTLVATEDAEGSLEVAIPLVLTLLRHGSRLSSSTLTIR